MLNWLWQCSFNWSRICPLRFNATFERVNLFGGGEPYCQYTIRWIINHQAASGQWIYNVTPYRCSSSVHVSFPCASLEESLACGVALAVHRFYERKNRFFDYTLYHHCISVSYTCSWSKRRAKLPSVPAAAKGAVIQYKHPGISTSEVLWSSGDDLPCGVHPILKYIVGIRAVFSSRAHTTLPTHTNTRINQIALVSRRLRQLREDLTHILHVDTGNGGIFALSGVSSPGFLSRMSKGTGRPVMVTPLAARHHLQPQSTWFRTSTLQYESNWQVRGNLVAHVAGQPTRALSKKPQEP